MVSLSIYSGHNRDYFIYCHLSGYFSPTVYQQETISPNLISTLNARMYTYSPIYAQTFPSGRPTVVYWDMSGRADVCRCLLEAGGIEYDLAVVNAWPNGKEECPFGQLPVLRHGDVTIAHSFAVARYCARLAGSYPENPVEASICDMIMDECADIFNTAVKPYFLSKDDKERKDALWKKLVEEYLPKHYGYLERLLGDGTYFGEVKPNAADIAFFAVQGFLEGTGVETKLGDGQFPKLKACVDGVSAGVCAGFTRGSPAISADPEDSRY